MLLLVSNSSWCSHPNLFSIFFLASYHHGVLGYYCFACSLRYRLSITWWCPSRTLDVSRKYLDKEEGAEVKELFGWCQNWRRTSERMSRKEVVHNLWYFQFVDSIFTIFISLSLSSALIHMSSSSSHAFLSCSLSSSSRPSVNSNNHSISCRVIWLHYKMRRGTGEDRGDSALHEWSFGRMSGCDLFLIEFGGWESMRGVWE